MDEMVERVAQAIEALRPYTLGTPIYDVQFVDIARAAITAMREPTEAMIKAGVDQVVGPVAYGLVRGYKAMIDAALKDWDRPEDGPAL